VRAIFAIAEAPPPAHHRLKNTTIVLGSTGSIGTQTLDLIRRNAAAGGRSWKVDGLAAGRSWKLLLEQAREFRPRFVAIEDLEAAEALAAELPAGIELLRGESALEELVERTEFDVCVHGVVGSRGLNASVGVLRRGKTLALANKESLVIAGELLMNLAREHGAEIIPVDSEHSAIFQCLRGEDIGRVRRVLLTASGGPFRQSSLEELENVRPEAALKHPNWDMGPRITIGSATLMNKALEVIELHHLFGLERDRIHVVVHPQSIVHSMVEFIDGSVIAQMGPPDMRGPIHYALHHPDRAPAPLTGFDFKVFKTLTFEEPDLERFPTLELGFRCVEEKSDAGCVLNASDEVAVQAFLDGRIRFQDIYRINRSVLEQREGASESIESLLGADKRARELARDQIKTCATPLAQ
jgi:1-deoxy-D-xylulose-5-phosphate reductoisomerase